MLIKETSTEFSIEKSNANFAYDLYRCKMKEKH